MGARTLCGPVGELGQPMAGLMPYMGRDSANETRASVESTNVVIGNRNRVRPRWMGEHDLVNETNGPEIVWQMKQARFGKWDKGLCPDAW